MIKLSKEKARVTNVKKVEYNGYPIILRQIGRDMFEYLIVWKDEIYNGYVLYSGSWWRCFLPRRFWFTDEERKSVNEILMSAASLTLDTLRGTTDNKRKKK